MPSSISMSAFGVAVLIGATGCTRTSDGSFVHAQARHVQPPDEFRRRQDQMAARSPAIVRRPPFTLRRLRPSAAKPQRQAKVTAPSLSLIKNPPFKRPDPTKPLTCRNEASSAGRIRVVCS